MLRSKAILSLLVAAGASLATPVRAEVEKRYHDHEKKHLAEESPRNGKGQYHGTRRFFTYDGKLERTVEYQADVKSGREIAYGSNGKPRTETTWVNDEKNGRARDFFEDGRLESEEIYKSGRREGAYSRYYPSGKIKETGAFKGDRLNGLVRRYAETGKLLSEETFRDGDTDLGGYKKIYDENGHLKEHTTFKKGKIATLAIYHLSGRVLRSEAHVNGQLARLVETSESGDVVEVTPFVAGEKHGRYEKKKMKRLVEEAEYKNGYLEGLQRQYDDKGRLMVQRTYRHGELTGEDVDYFTTGRVKAKKLRKSGKLDGEALFYYGNGNEMCRVGYKEGKRHGSLVCRYKNGKEMLRGTFENGDQVSLKTFDAEGREVLSLADAEEFENALP